MVVRANPGRGGFSIMRTPSRPVFETYEIVAIVAFVLAAVAVAALRLIA
jgi:hypothetical protein